MEFNIEKVYPKYDIAVIGGRVRVTFYCSVEHENITIDLCQLKEEQALQEAWSKARMYFNRCHKCGGWVCDEHYNEDVMKCIICQPK